MRVAFHIRACVGAGSGRYAGLADWADVVGFAEVVPGYYLYELGLDFEDLDVGVRDTG